MSDVRRWDPGNPFSTQRAGDGRSPALPAKAKSGPALELQRAEWKSPCPLGPHRRVRLLVDAHLTRKAPPSLDPEQPHPARQQPKLPA